MTFETPFPDAGKMRLAIRKLYQADETDCANTLLASLKISGTQRSNIETTATALVETIRNQNESHGGLDAFLQEFKLSSHEGIALMCLAEALLRVPDADTADQLIQDKLTDANWAAHLGESDSFFVNASTWGLMLTGKVISMDNAVVKDAGDYIGKLIAKSGEPFIRAAVKQAMRIMGKQFVLAETIETALKVAQSREKQGYCYSFDMLGEAALTSRDAEHYFKSYQAAIDAIGQRGKNNNPVSSPGISVKLSALHPRYEYAQENRVINELLPSIKQLCQQAKSYNIGLTIDAEETERLDPSLSILELLSTDADLKNWNGLGFVVQAYQKRAPAVLDWIEAIAVKNQRTIMLRLVKGAYWDSEIKKAQVEGYSDYPVYTRKITTDVAYLVCAQKLLSNPKAFYPLFATHNAHTVAAIVEFAENRRDFEFQCLHGMGEKLYDNVLKMYGVNCRIYAPVGPHKDLLAYLVRRLLENGANSSFVNRLVDKKLPITHIVADPIAALSNLEHKPHPNIPQPQNIYGNRLNSAGLNLNNALELESVFQSARTYLDHKWTATPILSGNTQKPADSQRETCQSPATGHVIGEVYNTAAEDINRVVINAKSAAESWDRLGGKSRAEILKKAADIFENNRNELLSLCIFEAGKTMKDAIAELREAVDFLRYYAVKAESEFAQPTTLNGPTGELNQWSLHGRGVFVCISPWNFPLAIFTGQVSAALAAGNCVLAKPAEQTPLIGYRAVQLLHQAGVPDLVLQFLPGDGETIGSALTAHPDIDGVCFTGSTDVAKIIQQTLAKKPGAIVPLIAETGGLNAMIVDSTALPEQVIRDVIQSAYQSAGQRCSALRILYLQEDIADGMIAMLKGAMAELKIGDPTKIDTDIGPIIDAQALSGLTHYIKCIEDKDKSGGDISGTVYRPDYRPAHDSDHSPVHRESPHNNSNQQSSRQSAPNQYDSSQDDATGYFMTPTLIEVAGIHALEREVFGPVLHVCRFSAADIDSVIEQINTAGYGLTFGVHSRIQTTIAKITQSIKAGNVYVNRNTIGAVVGVQPFGGEGLSGTGPKAGGPHYLHRFAVERSVSTDTTAAGGNTSLLSLEFL